MCIPLLTHRMPAPIVEKVISEGSEIYCERRGKGSLLLLITGAMEDAGFYSSATDILADEFTVVSYDRRCNSRSSGDRSVDMTVRQQAHDAASISIAFRSFFMALRTKTTHSTLPKSALS